MALSNNNISQLSTVTLKEDDESGTFSCVFSGPFNADQTTTVSFARKGNIVNVSISAVSALANGGAFSVATGATALGSNVSPLATIVAPASILTGSAKSNTLGKVSVDSAGVILVYRDTVESGLWSVINNNGWERISFSYLLF